MVQQQSLASALLTVTSLSAAACCQSGVLSVRSESGVWVINQHNVTRQLWLSSPVSGPSKYNWHRDKQREDEGGGTAGTAGEKGRWCSERDESKLLQPLLEQEFSQAFDVTVKFDDTF